MKNILIVEDNDQINHLLKEILEKTGNYTITQAFSGTEGLTYLQNKPFHLILLDLNLPGMKGQSLLEVVNQEMHIPVIVITANKDKKTRIEVLTQGADDFISKPFDLDEVLARVTAVLRRSSYSSSNYSENLIYKDISMDRKKHKVMVNNQQINLTAVEYKVLFLLLDNPEKVFTKANIYESVWDEPYFGDEAIINTHMSNLRNKLNKLGTYDAYIETVWGIGYKLAEE